jgi:hypothetical protein
MVMKRIVILVVLVFVIATSLALSAPIASAGPRCDSGEKPVFIQGRHGPPTFFGCEPAAGGGGPVRPR